MSEQIDQLQEDAAASQRIERAQRALIAQLRAEVGEEQHAERELVARLRAAELELVNLRAIRDALLPPTLVQREGMSIAAEVIPAEPYVGGDFLFVGDGLRGTVVVAVGDVFGRGLQAARRSPFARTVLAAVASFSDDPGRLLQWVNVALVERIAESAESVTAACVTYDPGTRRYWNCSNATCGNSRASGSATRRFGTTGLLLVPDGFLSRVEACTLCALLLARGCRLLRVALALCGGLLLLGMGLCVALGLVEVSLDLLLALLGRDLVLEALALELRLGRVWRGTSRSI